MAVELALRSARRRASCAPRSATATCSRSSSQRGWLLGGEGSGHLLALDKHTTGDGIVSALQVLQAVVRSGKSLAELLDGVTLFPQTLINVRLQPGRTGRATRRCAETQRDGRARAGRHGPRADPRRRGTEPVLRVMVEARDAARPNAARERLAAALGAERGRAHRAPRRRAARSHCDRTSRDEAMTACDGDRAMRSSAPPTPRPVTSMSHAPPRVPRMPTGSRTPERRHHEAVSRFACCSSLAALLGCRRRRRWRRT